jgi:hypothetical protein
MSEYDDGQGFDDGGGGYEPEPWNWDDTPDFRSHPAPEPDDPVLALVVAVTDECQTRATGRVSWIGSA